MSKLVITRHQSLVKYLIEIGLIDAETEVVGHATPELIKDRDVIGVLPHGLSCLCNTFTEVPLVLPQELRGQELTIDDIRKYAKPHVTYKVTKL